MNTAVVLSDLQTAREATQRALDRAAILGVGGAGLADGDEIARELRDVRHLLDRAINELTWG